MTNLSGGQIAEFLIQDRLGSGASGTVYRALQMPLHRIVALKVLDGGISELQVERFKREAEAMARMEHPHILPVYTAGFESPHHFIAMRFARNGTLGDHLDGGRPIDLTLAVKWLRQVVSALGHAHARGVIHRDVKPTNILLDGDTALLGDFGAARLNSGARITATGAAIGTPLYMSPEQTKGEQVGAATDIYSIGLLLYEVTAGRHPFIRSEDEPYSVLDLQLRIYERASKGLYPPVSSLRAGLPSHVDSIVDRCLAPNPEVSYPSALVLLKELNRLQAELASRGRNGAA